jgi:hypothetical protein
MDSALRYQSHIARAATKGLRAALALKRLKMLSPLTARQFFNTTVVPVVDYASSVWMHTVNQSAMAVLNRAQKIAACAIPGSFPTVALAVVEAEAYIRPVCQRHFDRATKLYLGIRTFPGTHPLTKSQIRIFRRFQSPLQRIALSHEQVIKIETIQPFSVAP